MAQKKILQRFLRFSTISGYFLWKHELYPILHEDHENRQSGYFLRQLNDYLAMSTFKNRNKLKTAKNILRIKRISFFAGLTNKLCFLTNKHQFVGKTYLKTLV
jgi:hypothetical protein